MTLKDTQSEIYARHLVELGFLENLINQKGYSSELIEASKNVPYHTLLINLEPDAQGRPRQMTLTFYPLDAEQFPNTLFLQYFTELPVQIQPETLDEVTRLLIFLNNKLVVGNFGIAQGQNKLNHRYVQTLPSDEIINENIVFDAITLFNYTSILFGNLLESVATGKMSAVEAEHQADRS